MAQMRPDQCANALRALRVMPATELARVLTACDRSRRRAIGSLLGTRLPMSGRVSETQSRLLRTDALRATSTAKVTDALDVLVDHVRDRTLEVLGDDFDDPSAEAVEALVAELRDEFDDDLVRLYLALSIDGDAVASPLLVPYLAPDGPLAIHEVTPIESSPQRATPRSEEHRAVRATRRRAKAREKSERREQREHARHDRRPRRSTPTAPPETLGGDSPTSTAQPAIDTPRLLHPHVGRYVDVSAASPHRGQVGTAFIPFSGRDGKEGKFRPCVVVAAGRKHALLRPIYSYARRPAGGWRAVELREWEAAGLDHCSWVGGELHQIRWREIALIGTLTIADWNRICRGEVN